MSPKSLRTYRLELDFRRDRPGLRAWLHTQAELRSAHRHQARTSNWPLAPNPKCEYNGWD